MYGWVIGWMDGWIDGWKEWFGWLDDWLDECDNPLSRSVRHNFSPLAQLFFIFHFLSYLTFDIMLGGHDTKL